MIDFSRERALSILIIGSSRMEETWDEIERRRARKEGQNKETSDNVISDFLDPCHEHNIISRDS